MQPRSIRNFSQIAGFFKDSFFGSLLHVPKVSLVVFALFAVGVMALFLIQKEEGRDLEKYASQLVDSCINSSPQLKGECYMKETSSLSRMLSMEELFNIVRLVQKEDTEYAYCHNLGHTISEYEAAKDPSNWTEVLTRCPEGQCSNGCLHGAFQARFRKESISGEEMLLLQQELQGVCERRKGWDPTPFMQEVCYHGMGHLATYVTDAELDRAVAICDSLATNEGWNFRHRCYEGLFMQIFQPIDQEDRLLVEDIRPVNQKQAREFCDQFEVAERADACWQNAWIFFVEEFIEEGPFRFCSQSYSTQQEQKCYEMAFNAINFLFNFSPERVADYCRNLQGSFKDKETCFHYSQKAMLQADTTVLERAVLLCELSGSAFNLGCYQSVASEVPYLFRSGSAEQKALCTLLPDKHEQTCLGGGVL